LAFALSDVGALGGGAPARRAAIHGLPLLPLADGTAGEDGLALTFVL